MELRELRECNICDSSDRKLALKVNGKNICYICLEFFTKRAKINNKKVEEVINEDTIYMNENPTIQNNKKQNIVNGSIAIGGYKISFTNEQSEVEK